VSLLSKKAWSPYAAGIVIALLQIPAFLIIGSPLGASSSFVKIAGHLGQMFDPAIAEISYFDKYMFSSKYYWQLALIIGIALGAFASARLSGTGREGHSPIWQKVMHNYSPSRRRWLAFIGGFVMLFGARFAGGCTSGHGISGMSQLAVGSIVTVIFMFAGGILTARFLRSV
jgi:hypothetical protein